MSDNERSTDDELICKLMDYRLKDEIGFDRKKWISEIEQYEMKYKLSGEINDVRFNQSTLDELDYLRSRVDFLEIQNNTLTALIYDLTAELKMSMSDPYYTRQRMIDYISTRMSQ